MVRGTDGELAPGGSRQLRDPRLDVHTVCRGFLLKIGQKGGSDRVRQQLLERRQRAQSY
jgi:hypothetical protein